MAFTAMVNQEYYAARMDDYVLIFIINYGSDEQERKAVIGSITFAN